MNFHFPSFLLGYGAGVASALLADRLRPLLVDLATAAMRVTDRVARRVAMASEDVEDALAEARTRARRQPKGRRPAPSTRKRA
jgi:hypothetical protein